MKCSEYIKTVETSGIDDLKLKSVEKVYGKISDELVRKIISHADDTIFFDDNVRSLSFNEIIDAEKDLHVNFKLSGLLPLFDCLDNDFIVYNMLDSTWAKFNIVDEAVFKKRSSLIDLL